jgi:enoyl-CoA hydratase/carnithine racemase
MKGLTEIENQEDVLYEKDGHVALITLNRPDRYNAASHGLVEGLIGALDKASNDADVRAVVIRGAGRGFCAGADMLDFGTATPEQVAQYIPMYYGTIVRKITMMPKPVIAAIHGSAAGVGTAFALACDLRVMGEGANIRYAFINIGLGPDGGSGWLLARTIGYSRAFEIIVEGEKIPASRCLSLGLANRVVADDHVLDEAISWAKKLAARPTLGIAITKDALHHATTHTLMETTVLEAENQAVALRSHDHREGVQAFLEKRTPKFEGK